MKVVSRTFISLKERDFRFLVLSSLGIGLGQWLQQIGLGWLLYERTGQATQLAFLYAIRGGTALVAAPIGGVLGDRFSRRLVLIVVTLASATQASILSVLVLSGQVQVWHLYAFMVLEALTNGINQPTRQAFVFNITTRENLTNAISLNTIANNISRIVGPNLAGMIIGFAGVGYCFLSLAVMKLTATFFTFMIRASAGRPGAARKKESPFASFVEGIRYAAKDKAIMALILINGVKPLLILPYVGFLPVFAKDVFYKGDEGWAVGYGLLASGLAFGAIPSALFLAYKGNFKGMGMVMIITLFGYDAMILLFSRQEIIWLGWACLIGSGVFFVISTTLTTTLLQLWTKDDGMRARVMSLQSLESGLQPLGSLPMGMAIDRFGAPNTVSAFTTAAAVSVFLIAILFPQIRRDPELTEERVEAG